MSDLNRIVHFEISANQPEALTRFYSNLFGWKFLCDTGSSGPGIMRLKSYRFSS